MTAPDRGPPQGVVARSASRTRRPGASSSRPTPSWRAARIVLDSWLHRGGIGVAEAIEALVEHTGFERPNAVAEVRRSARVPTYDLSYLLGKVLLLRLRDDERRRLGDASSLRDLQDALIDSGSLPISFHRRLLAGEGGGPTRPDAPLVG